MFNSLLLRLFEPNVLVNDSHVLWCFWQKYAKKEKRFTCNHSNSHWIALTSIAQSLAWSIQQQWQKAQVRDTQLSLYLKRRGSVVSDKRKFSTAKKRTVIVVVVFLQENRGKQKLVNQKNLLTNTGSASIKILNLMTTFFCLQSFCSAFSYKLVTWGYP